MSNLRRRSYVVHVPFVLVLLRVGSVFVPFAGFAGSASPVRFPDSVFWGKAVMVWRSSSLLRP